MSNQNFKTLDDYLDHTDYAYLNSNKYIPTDFSLMFLNFIQLVNGERGESNKTPPVHLAMLDTFATSKSNLICNLIFRGAAKTTVFGEYLVLFTAVFNVLPGLGETNGIIYVGDSMENGAKSLRKNIEHRYRNSEFLQENLPEKYAVFTDPYIEFTNTKGIKTGLRLFGATSGIRGIKIFGKRPKLGILDDLMSDEASKSKATLDLIKDTVYNGVLNALDPTGYKVIFNGTPFNKQDVIVEAVDSGAWDVNVFPVCEKFPCTKEEFRGAWEDRFPYEFVKSRYDLALQTGKKASFFQELMLRITSEEDRLVTDSDIKWYERNILIKHKGYYNFYITTDFATSSKDGADFSVISVWAINNNGDMFLVDGRCERSTMDTNIDSLFLYVSMYKPQGVGIEVTGQQGGFIPWIQREMLNRNCFFNLSNSNNSGKPGIRPLVDKLSRFNIVLPWFKMGKFFFPKELKDTPFVKEMIDELRLITATGIKGKDDCIDTISMLGMINMWRPGSTYVPEKEINKLSLEKEQHNLLWEFNQNEEYDEDTASIRSYLA